MIHLWLLLTHTHTSTDLLTLSKKHILSEFLTTLPAPVLTANTIAWVLKENAPGIPPEDITCLARLDHNRAKTQVHNCELSCTR